MKVEGPLTERRLNIVFPNPDKEIPRIMLPAARLGVQYRVQRLGVAIACDSAALLRRIVLRVVRQDFQSPISRPNMDIIAPNLAWW